MNQATRHMTPDAWLGVPLQLAIRDLAVVNGYAGALSVRTARRGTDAGRNRPLAVASVAVPSHGFTLLFRPLAAMEPNSFTALVTDRTGNIVWQEDTDHPSYYEAYDLARRVIRTPRTARRPRTRFPPTGIPAPSGRSEAMRRRNMRLCPPEG